MHSNREDTPIVFQIGSNYIRQIEWGDMDLDFWALSAGFDAAPLFKGLPNGCECPHWGYLFKGRMRVKYADHEEVVTAGEAYYLPAGHIPVMEEDCEMVEFSPKDENRKMMEIAGRNMMPK
jgi:hypothetical protein